MLATETPQLEQASTKDRYTATLTPETPLPVESPVESPGASVESPPAAAPPAQPKRAWYWRWVDNGPAVLAILFLVTGAFGLPLLYHSRAFSVRTKWVIAIANLIYTGLTCYWAYVETMRYATIIQNALQTM